MSHNRKMTRPDATQQNIVKQLRAAGVLVWIIGWPCDLLTYYRSRWQTLECKPVKNRIRRDQASQDEFLAQTRTPIVRTPDEALDCVIGAGLLDRNGKHA
jgi:hypothetical protein